jgi:hypothetical protein
MATSIRINQLPFPRFIGIHHNKKITLHQDLHLEQWIIPAGTKVIIWQTQNFGWCLLPEGTKDKTGYIIHRRLFKY